MTYMQKDLGPPSMVAGDASASAQTPRQMMVVIIEDGMRLSELFRSVCECLDVAVEQISSLEELGPVLHACNPMAVVAEMDAVGQDGCHVLKTVATHDRS